ncbi:hypothetical protein NDU88_003326 [Pleurodeles waltl]|uniref:Uncharacterized protein n=1 Tax=Pleurodeles waltl TaxID=8319 RepID=A0AAV7W4N6_PLEWA|nr:hypothetical protein NDU88_003326 [Pleurodeles waltl]
MQRRREKFANNSSAWLTLRTGRVVFNNSGCTREEKETSPTKFSNEPPCLIGTALHYRSLPLLGQETGTFGKSRYGVGPIL